MGAKTRARGDPKAGASCKGFSHNFVKIEIRKAAVFPVLFGPDRLRHNQTNHMEAIRLE